MNPIVKKFLQKQLFKQKGTIASAKSVQFSYDALETRMKNLGLDINLIKTEKDLSQALGFVKNIEDQVFKKQFGDVLSKKDTAKVFDLEGRQLDTKKPIMGGTQDEGDILQKSIKKNVKEATEKGDFKGIANQVLRDPDIAREFMLSKKFPFRRDTNVLSGEDAIPLARKAKFDEEMGIKSVAPRDYSVEKLVSDFKKFGNATDKDIQMILSSGKSGQIPYVMDNYGMSYIDVINTLKRGDDLIEGLASGGRAGFKDGTFGLDILKLEDEAFQRAINAFKYYKSTGGKKNFRDYVKGAGDKGDQFRAEGGRAGFKLGSPSQHKFLGIMGSLAATIAAIKSGLIGAPKKEITKQVIKESAKDVGSAPPKYFFDLANKIKLLGKESKVKPQERVNEYNYVGKNGDEYTLTEDISTGDMQITKDKIGGVRVSEDEVVDGIADRSVMDYKAPKKDVDVESGKGTSEPEIYEEYKVKFDEDGSMVDDDVISEYIKKEIIQESSEIPEKKIKRAGGGVAYMLGE